MIETYAFFAAFLVQILAMSVLHPAWFVRYVRVRMESCYEDERYVQLYPGVERTGVERFLTLYRTVNACIAVLGLLLLGWLFNYVQRQYWNDMVALYFMLQVLPLFVLTCLSVWSNKKARERSQPEVKRTASLQRRGLFDFISPFVVSLAVLGYLLFAAFVIYIEADPIKLGAVTLVYALEAFVVYRRLYGRKSYPLETRADRMHWTGLTVKICVYACIATVVFVSLDLVVLLLGLQQWDPFAQSVFFVITALLCSIGLTTSPRQPKADELGPSPVS